MGGNPSPIPSPASPSPLSLQVCALQADNTLSWTEHYPSNSEPIVIHMAAHCLVQNLGSPLPELLDY